MLAENNRTNEDVVPENCLSTSVLPNIGPSQVLPFLYLGSQDDALSVQTMKGCHITHVINVSVTGVCAPFLDEHDNEHFLRIPIHDSLTEKLLPYLDDAFLFIENARTNHGRVFIHCLAGISRSPALAIAYIMRFLSLSADDAYRYVKQRRAHISPNFNFLGQLSEYERRLETSSIGSAKVHNSEKCCKFEEPVNERCRFIPVATCSNNSAEPLTTVPQIPVSFDLPRIQSLTSRRLLSLPLSFGNLSQERISQTTKVTRPNSINFQLPAMKTEPNFTSLNNPRTNSASKTTDGASNKDKTSSLVDSNHESTKKVPNNCNSQLLVL